MSGKECLHGDHVEGSHSAPWTARCPSPIARLDQAQIVSESFRLRTTVNDPFAQLTAALTVIANGHKLSRINELLP